MNLGVDRPGAPRRDRRVRAGDVAAWRSGAWSGGSSSRGRWGSDPARIATLKGVCRRSWISSRRSCSWSSSRRSRSAMCRPRAAGWPSVWHPDIAPPGKQLEHERHLKAVNEAADQLERLAEGSRGGKVSRNAVKVSAAAARAARAEAGRRNYEAQERARAQAADRQTHDPFGDRMPDHSVVHRYARCNSYPEWGVGTVSGIYFTGDGDDVQQWARVKFAPGVRTVPGRLAAVRRLLQARPGAERVQRFMTAAQHAMAEGKPELAAQRLIYARDAEPENTAVLRLMTLAFWQAGNLPAAGRSVRDWARVERDRPTPHRFAARIYEDMGAIDLAAEAADRAVQRGPRRRGRVGARRPSAAAARGPRARDRRAGAGPAARAEPRRAARPRAGVPARRRPRRRGQRVRARGAPRRRTARPRGRAWPTRWRAPTVSARRSTPASTRSPSRRATTRSRTSSCGCATRCPRVLPAA